MAGSITVNTNISAINTQRRLGQATYDLQSSFTRLSSGLRINRAKDDAAGLAISEGLNVDARIYAQAVRNLNDGLSMLNVAEGALSELSSIVIRQLELAQQSANGTLSSSQRTTLQHEANSLVTEYNRIVQTTSFNDIKLLDTSTGELSIQAGYRDDGSIAISLTSQTTTMVGDGTFLAQTEYHTQSDPGKISSADFNHDGFLDLLIASNVSTGYSSIQLGNGDGSFYAVTTIASNSITAADFNDDGLIDLGAAYFDADQIGIMFGHGDGSVDAPNIIAAGNGPGAPIVGDFNLDGKTDFISASSKDVSISVFLGTGNGSFAAPVSYSQPKTMGEGYFEDFNNDGVQDLAISYTGNATFGVLFGNSNGSFKAPTIYSTLGTDGYNLTAGDVDGDGHTDIIIADRNANIVNIALGNGNGTFQACTGYQAGDKLSDVKAGDLNGDDILDLVVSSYNDDTLRVLVGNGDGSFSIGSTLQVADKPEGLVLEDFNSDGVLDLINTANGADTINVFLGNGITRTVEDSLVQSSLELRNQAASLHALDSLESDLARINEKLAKVGSIQSRFSVSITNLQVKTENILKAKSAISDTDLADESAKLVRTKILQETATAVLAQANQSPSLALSLLNYL